MDDKLQNSLLPIIYQHCEQGATIISDSIDSYVNYRSSESHIENMGFTHFWVNHSPTFTQTLSRVEKPEIFYFSNKEDFSSDILESHINTFMTFNNIKQEYAYQVFISILKDYFTI